MATKKSSWKTFATILAVCVMLGLVTRAVMAGPPMVPNAKDAAGATRNALPPLAGAVDEKVMIPDGQLVGGNGIVEPLHRETKVAAQVPGLVSEIHVKEGDKVEAGTVLVTLDAQSERAALAAAEADVALSKAELERSLGGLRAEDVDATIAEADAAKAKAELSDDILARTEGLAKGGASTPDELDRARRNAAADRANASASDARRRAALAGSRHEDIAEARAKLASATARRDQSKAQLERLTIRAASYGEILQIKLRVGEYYVPAGSEPLLIMGDTRKLRVRLDVDERDVGKLHEGAKAFIVADGFRGEKFPGNVAEIGHRMGRKNVRSDDPIERIDTKILEVVIDLDDSSKLIPGLRVMGYVSI